MGGARGWRRRRGRWRRAPRRAPPSTALRSPAWPWSPVSLTTGGRTAPDTKEYAMADRTRTTTTVADAGRIDLGGDLTVNRLGFGAMRLTGPGIWGEPEDPQECRRVLQRALELGVTLIDTADSYGPEGSERLIA